VYACNVNGKKEVEKKKDDNETWSTRSYLFPQIKGLVLRLSFRAQFPWLQQSEDTS